MASWIDPNVSQEELAQYFDLNVAPFTWEPTRLFLKARNEQYNAGVYDPEAEAATMGTLPRCCP